MWTTHERRAAQERAIKEKGAEYILPVRIDNTPLAGLSDSVAYVPLTQGIGEIARLLEKKLRSSGPEPSTAPVGLPETRSRLGGRRTWTQVAVGFLLIVGMGFLGARFALDKNGKVTTKPSPSSPSESLHPQERAGAGGIGTGDESANGAERFLRKVALTDEPEDSSRTKLLKVRLRRLL